MKEFFRVPEPPASPEAIRSLVVWAGALPEADFAFFDLRASGAVPTREILAHSIAFRVAVHKSAWTTGRWKRIDRVMPEPALMQPQAKFMQDAIDGRLSIYLAGQVRPASLNECVGLERCAVWDPEHVESRLRDHFAGRPNVWVKQLSLKEERL